MVYHYHDKELKGRLSPLETSQQCILLCFWKTVPTKLVTVLGTSVLSRVFHCFDSIGSCFFAGTEVPYRPGIESNALVPSFLFSLP